jgi:hypothetical protein
MVVLLWSMAMNSQPSTPGLFFHRQLAAQLLSSLGLTTSEIVAGFATEDDRRQMYRGVKHIIAPE